MKKILGKKTIQVLQQIDSKELERFEKYLAFGDPIGRTNNWKLFQALKTKLHKPPSSEKIWAAIHPDKPLDIPKLRRYFSNLLAQLEQYWHTQGKDWDRWEREIELIKTYNDLQLYDIAQGKIEKLKKKLGQLPSLGPQERYVKHLLALEQHRISIRQSPTKPISKINLVMRSFEEYWILQKLMYACIALSQNNLFRQQLEIPNMKLLLPIIDQSDFVEDGLICIYREIYLILAEDKSWEMEDFYQKIPPNLPKHDVKSVFDLLLNQSIKSLNQSQNADMVNLDRTVKMYEWGMKEKCLFIQDFLIPKHYKNIIRMWVHVKEYDKARYYLDHWKAYLHLDVQEEYHTFCDAMISIEERQGKGWKAKLQTYPFKNVVLKIQSRLFVIRLIYDENLGEYDWQSDMESTLKKTRAHINQSPISDYHKEPFLKFCTYSLKLIRATHPSDYLSIKDQLEEEVSVDHHNWLQEKIQEGIDRK